MEEYKNSCLLYPALQKHYSALTNLNAINPKDGIFEIIPKIDAFLSESRNITFMVQESFKTNELKKFYTSKRDEFLKNDVMKWFVDKRNMVIHSNPFKLEKVIIISIYNQINKFTEFTTRLTIDNDQDFSKLITDIEDILKQYYSKHTEVFFSIEIMLSENNCDINIYKIIMDGLKIMSNFIKVILAEVTCSCQKCQNIESKIEDLTHELMAKEDLIFIKDCYFYNNKITIGGQIVAKGYGPNKRMLLSNDPFWKDIDCTFDINILKSFAATNITIAKQKAKESKREPELLNSFMIVYEDNTFSMSELFSGTVKTTGYRMINKIANHVKTEPVRAILYLFEGYVFPYEKWNHINKMSYGERTKHYKETHQVNVLISKQLDSITAISVDYDRIHDNSYNYMQLNNPEYNYKMPILYQIYDALKKNANY